MSLEKEARVKAAYGTREWFDGKYQGVWDDPWGLSWRPSQEYRYTRMLQVLSKYVPRCDVDVATSVVDIGCATGEFTSKLLHEVTKGGEVLGVDFSKAAIDRARDKYPHINFEQWSVEDIAIKAPKSVDAVTCLEVIYYIPPEERKLFISKIKSILSDGGIALLSSLNANYPYLGIKDLTALVASDFEILESGRLYLKPLATAEKTLMALVTTSGKDRTRPRFLEKMLKRCMTPKRVLLMERILKSILKERAVSHVYVVGRKKTANQRQ